MTRQALPVVTQLFTLALAREDFSIEQWARDAGVSSRNLFMWKAGKRHPRLDLFVYSVEALGYEVRLIKKP